MIRVCINVVLIIAIVSVSSTAGDLYRVEIDDPSDVDLLESFKAVPVKRLANDYLALIEPDLVGELEANGLVLELIASGLKKDDLAFSNWRDLTAEEKEAVIFRRDQLSLVNIDRLQSRDKSRRTQMAAVGSTAIKFKYSPETILNRSSLADLSGLSQLVDAISQDSVEAAMHRLEAFNYRYTGYDSSAAVEDWIFEKFESYGFDAVYFDSFLCPVFPAIEGYYGRNVVAIKTGTRFPNRQIVIGAHHDAIADCPGADDNGSGTIGVLEMARVLAPIETEMTVVFVTFTAEEQGLKGSSHYAEEAFSQGDSIMLMMNLDMIGHYENSTEAHVQSVPQPAYGELWISLADSLAGITATADLNSASDHTRFLDAGYEVLVAQEQIFSSQYHRATDSTTYINMDYLTRMIKASAATLYTIAASLPPLDIIVARNVGDGSSVQVEWDGYDDGDIASYTLYFESETVPGLDSLAVSADSSSFIVAGLTEDETYRFHVFATDLSGTSTVISAVAYCTVSTVPSLPPDQLALPIHNGIRLLWSALGAELDLDHYGIVRDGEMYVEPYYDTIFEDTDPSLGTGFHSYLIVSVDDQGTMCDTIGADQLSMRTAPLSSTRVLALNKASHNEGFYLVNPDSSNSFLEQALEGLNFDLLSDTAHSKTVGLLDLTDYGLVIISQESARYDELNNFWTGFLDTLAYYLSIGGKAIVYGRWGKTTSNIDINPPDTVLYDPKYSAWAYTEDFNIQRRILPPSVQDGSWGIKSDLIGGLSQVEGYPDLVWDSLATASHIQGPWYTQGGIPCGSFVDFVDPNLVEILYTYNSSSDSIITEGKPVAWKYTEPEMQYVHFELPLSMMQQETAISVLLQAMTDLGFDLDACCIGVRGNTNADQDENVNISDITYLVDYLFGIPSGSEPVCREEGNANGDIAESVNISDVSYLVDYLFGVPLGPAPPACE